MIAPYIQKLKDHAQATSDGESLLALLYEAYSEVHRLDNAQIKEDFNELYGHMNGMTLHEMDQILDPVCSLCRNHERAGFLNGVKIGVMLAYELGK